MHPLHPRDIERWYVRARWGASLGCITQLEVHPLHPNTLLKELKNAVLSTPIPTTTQ
jgi:hypothetical protein